MSDDARYTGKIYQHPPEQLIAYYKKHVYSPAQEPLHIQRSDAAICPPIPPPTICYGAQ